jgi:hypothetical protein
MTRTGPFELRSQRVGALPIVDRFLERIGLERALARHLPAPARRGALAPARALGVVVRNLCLAREPLYGLGEWARCCDPAALGLTPDELALVNDDRVGRALDRLFDADRASLLCELVLGVIAEFGIDTGELHNDSTSFALHGAYADADGRPRAGKRTPVPARGHSKDHRPDLKQLVLTLTVARDGAVPLAHRLLDGNTNDDTTHIESWNGLVALTRRADFLYVADSKLATRAQMAHIDARGGRFVTVLPRSRSEDGRLRAWMRSGEARFAPAARAPARRAADPDDVWSVAPAPIASVEGYRIVWVHSSAKHRLDESARADSIARGLAALDALARRLAGPKCRLRERAEVERAAGAALEAKRVGELVRFELSERLERRVSERARGPGRAARRRTTTKPRFTLGWEVDEAAVARAAACDGCYPLVSNDRERSDAELLAAYRYQPKLEQRNHQLKGVLDAAPVYLKSPARIEALFTCLFFALLVHALVERELRRAMADAGIERLALYPERRACRAPTAARVFELFATLDRHRLLRDGERVQDFEPELDGLQGQLLELLGVSPSAYRSAVARP